MTIEELIRKRQGEGRIELRPPTGQPLIEMGHSLPPDLRRFYELAGGGMIRAPGQVWQVVSPDQFLLANPVIVGDTGLGDRSASWYIIGIDDQGNHISIDLDPSRLGRCYDSNFEVHAVAGSCSIVAMSFTDLFDALTRRGHGSRPFWLQDGFVKLGDAYD